MRALLLAAGFGTRLGEITSELPKCLVKIGDETMLDHWLYKLNALGVTDFIINTHYLSEQVIEFAESHPLRHNIFLSYEEELLGTAATVLKHSDFLKQTTSFIIHVDNFCQDDLKNFLIAHERRPTNSVCSMLTFETKTPDTCGVVELDEKNMLIAFYEKQLNPPSNIANGAVYIASADFFDELQKLGPNFTDISRDIIPKFIGKIYCYQTNGFFEDIGSIKTLEETKVWRQSHRFD